MRIDIKEAIEQGNMSKAERLKTILEGAQNFYLDELKETKNSLENIKKVIQYAPDIIKGNNT